MKIVTGERGCGVTTDLIHMAFLNNGIIVVPNQLTKVRVENIIYEEYGKHGARRVDVITVKEFKSPEHNRDYYDRHIYVDNLELILKDMLGCQNVSAVGYTI